MKKIIMAVAVVASAMVASAASFDWKTSATGKIDSAGTTDLLGSATAYIFDSAAITMTHVVSEFVASGKMKAGSLNNKAVTAGVIKATNAEAFSWTGTTLEAFFAIIDGDNIFVSTIVPAYAQDVGYTQLSFNAKAASQAAAAEFAAGNTVSASGWYTAAAAPAVPEPTSGLLLLLGMAGLALKRKHA